MTDSLSTTDVTRMHAAYSGWVRSRENRDFHRADRLRQYLENAGLIGPDYTRWHPVFETPAHRSRRLRDRTR